MSKNEEDELSKQFSDIVDRMLSGQEIRAEEVPDEDCDLVHIVQRMINCRTTPRSAFQIRLKNTLVSESMREPRKKIDTTPHRECSRFWKALRGVAPQPAWRVAMATLLVVVLISSALYGTGIFNSSTAHGKAIFAISDAAADMGSVSSIIVTIDSIEVKNTEDNGWQTASSDIQTYDLLRLKNEGAIGLLAETDLDEGIYDQIRLNISDVTVVDANGSHEAILPSTTVQLKGHLEVEKDKTTTANFDFIADQSLHLTGKGTYIFAPVIQLEIRNDAQVQRTAENHVNITAGRTTTDIRLGMDIEGNIAEGLLITCDAILTIQTDSIVQTRGQVIAIGTIKAIDTDKRTITITTNKDSDLVLRVAATKIEVNDSRAHLDDLTIDDKVHVQYSANTLRISKLVVLSDEEDYVKDSISLTLRGTSSSIDIPTGTTTGTMTIIADSGAQVVLRLESTSQILVNGAINILTNLLPLIGLNLEVEYDANTHTIREIHVTM